MVESAGYFKLKQIAFRVEGYNRAVTMTFLIEQKSEFGVER